MMSKRYRFAAGAVAVFFMAGAAAAGGEKESSAGGLPRLVAIPTGNVVLYLGTGLRSSLSVDAAVAVHCTSYVPDGSPSPYPIQVTIELYNFNSALVTSANLSFSGADQTRTYTSQATSLYADDVGGSVALNQGSLRIHAPKAVASGILCSADQTSTANPPAYQRDIPLTRVAKFKPPKPTF